MVLLKAIFIILFIFSLGCAIKGMMDKRRNIGFCFLALMVALGDIFSYVLLGVQSFRDASGVFLPYYILHAWPEIYATSKESDTVNLYMEEIQKKVDESGKDFITGKEDIESKFDDYISELEALNLGEVIEVKQTQYNRYLKALQ